MLSTTRALHTGPFHEALRAAITARGLTLRSIQRHLAARGVVVSVATLSYWQSGERRPQSASLRAVTGLETVLKLPHSSLTRLLTGTPILRPAKAKTWAQVSADAEAIQRLLGRLGPDLHDRLRVVSQHEFAEIDAARGLGACVNTVVVEAYRKSDRYLFTYQADPGNTAVDLQIDAEMNCRVGRMYAEPDSRVVVAELLFDRVLLPGETHIFRYGYRDRSGFEQHNLTRSLRAGADVYVQAVRFTAPALPVRLFRCDSGQRLPVRANGRTELFLDPHHVVHTVDRSVRPGVYGITWVWP